MSVRIKPELVQRKTLRLIKHPALPCVRRTSKRKRVSLLTPLEKDLQRLSQFCGDIQRCDAMQPCTPCIQLNGGSDCVYEQNPVTQRIRNKLPAAVQPFLFSFNSEPSQCGSRSSRATSEDISLSAFDSASPDTSSSVFSSAPSSSNVSPKGSSPDSDTLDEFEPPTPREISNPGMQLVPSRRDSPKSHQPATISTFSFLPSLRLASIPRPFHTPLSILNPECFQVSDTTSSELDLSLCEFPFFESGVQKSRELISFDQPPCSARTIETLWDLSDRPQARRCNARRHFKHHRPSVLCLRHGWERNAYLCRC